MAFLAYSTDMAGAEAVEEALASGHSSAPASADLDLAVADGDSSSAAASEAHETLPVAHVVAPEVVSEPPVAAPAILPYLPAVVARDEVHDGEELAAVGEVEDIDKMFKYLSAVRRACVFESIFCSRPWWPAFSIAIDTNRTGRGQLQAAGDGQLRVDSAFAVPAETLPAVLGFSGASGISPVFAEDVAPIGRLFVNASKDMQVSVRLAPSEGLVLGPRLAVVGTSVFGGSTPAWVNSLWMAAREAEKHARIVDLFRGSSSCRVEDETGEAITYSPVDVKRGWDGGVYEPETGEFIKWVPEPEPEPEELPLVLRNEERQRGHSTLHAVRQPSPDERRSFAE